MPKELDKCVNSLLKQGKSKESAYAICTASLKKTGKLADDEAKEELLNVGFNEDDIKNILNDKFSVSIPIKLNEDGTVGDITDIEMLKTGFFFHSMYGSINITDNVLNSFIKNFKANILGRDIAFDVEHDYTEGATGWLKKLRKVNRKNSDKDERTFLVGSVDFTDLGRDLIKSGKYKYFSIEYSLDFKDREDHNKSYGPTVLGGALTNRPYIPGLRPIKVGDKIKFSEDEKLVENESFKEIEFINENTNKEEVVSDLGEEELFSSDDVAMVFEEDAVLLAVIKDIPWSKVDKTKLPASAFAYIGDKNKKSTWKLPYKNPDGSINPNGVSAAYAAIHGARGGVKGISSEAKSKILKLWKLVSKWRESKKKHSDKEVISVDALKLLEAQLEEYKTFVESAEDGSDEKKEYEKKVKYTEDAIIELKGLKEIEEKSKKLNDEEDKESENSEEAKLSDNEDKDNTEDEVKELKKKLDEAIKEKNEVTKRLNEFSEDASERILSLEKDKKKGEIRERIIKFRGDGVPKLLIDFYEKVALAENIKENTIVKLSEDNKSIEYSAGDLVAKVLELLPDESKIKLSEDSKSGDLKKSTDSEYEAEMVEHASKTVKNIKKK